MRSNTFLLALLAFAWVCMSPLAASAATPIFGNITSNQTWTAAGSPYVIGQYANIAIDPDVTLTIEAGTTVTLAASAILTVNGILNSAGGSSFLFGSNASLDMYGTLNATGTAGSPVLFDSSAPVPTRGSWGGINLYEAASVLLDHCTIRHGVYNISSQMGSSSIVVSNSTITDSSFDGIFVAGYMVPTTLSITNSTISGNVGLNSNGIYLAGLAENNGPVTISGNIITNNGDAGIFANGALSNLTTIRNNIITGNRRGIKTWSSNLTVGGSTAPDSANYIFLNSDYGILSTRDPEIPTDPYINISATHNWWGSPTGPFHSTNSNSTGNAVSDHVTFSPFFSGPAASLSPQSIDFGGVSIGSTSAAQSIAVTNSGDLPLLLGTILPGGTDSAVLAITADTCSNTTLAPAASCSVIVTFSPGSVQIYSASIDFPANGNTIPTTYSVAVSGSGTLSLVYLSIDFLGTGGGIVTYNSTDSTKDSIVTAINGTNVSFSSTPDQYSLFTGWGGSCAGTGICSFTAPGPTGGITATFDRKINPVKIEPDLFFSSITGTGSAYASAASSGTTIKTWGTDYTEALLFDQVKAVILDGGYDSSYNPNPSGMTTVKGAMTIKCFDAITCGSVGVRNLTIRQHP